MCFSRRLFRFGLVLIVSISFLHFQHHTAEANLTNGGFETGDFPPGWTATHTLTTSFPWDVAGSGGLYGDAFPHSGNYNAINGFSGSTEGKYILYQDVVVPAGVNTGALSFWYRAQWQLFTAPGPRTLTAQIQDPATGSVLTTLHHFETPLSPMYTRQDTGWINATGNFSVTPDSTIRVYFENFIPAGSSGSGQMQYDDIELTFSTSSTQTDLEAEAACDGDNLAVTIHAGDGPFDITTANGTGNASSVSTGETLLNGPNLFEDVTVTEQQGDTEQIVLGTYNCGTPGALITESGGQTAVDENGPTSDTYTIVLTASPDSGETVTITLGGFDAQYGVVPSPQTLQFDTTNWQIPQTVAVTAVDDALYESNPHTDTITHAVSNSGGTKYSALTSADTLTVSISDNDEALPQVSIDDVTVPEGAGGSFTITLNPPSAETVTLNYTFQDGTATNPDDYTPDGGLSSGQITFPPGTTTQTLPFSTTDDGLYEGTETFTVQLSLASGTAQLADDTGTGTITDAQGTPQASIDDVTVAEGTGGSFTISLNPPSAETVTLNYTFQDGTAANPDDYTPGGGQSSGQVSFSPGTTTQTLPFSTTNDGLYEGTETFTVQLILASGTAQLTDDTGTGTITDAQTTPQVSIDDVTVTEGTSDSFTVSLNPPSAETVILNYTFQDGTATNPDDYTPDNGLSSGQATFPPGTTTQTLAFSTTNDGLYEGTETFTVQLSLASGTAQFTDDTGTGTITDAQGTPQVSIDDVTVAEGTGGSFTISLNPPSAETITLNYTFQDGTATNPDDYTPDGGQSSGQVSFSPGTTTQTLPFSTTDDGLYEGTETFTVQLSLASGTAQFTDDMGTGTITDAQGTPQVNIDDVTVAEGAGGNFTVSLNPPSAETVILNYTFQDGTATNPDDYTPDGGQSSGQATFPPGTTTQTLAFSTTNDGLYEGTETFTVQLSLASGTAQLADDTGTGTITDAQSTPQVSIDDVTVAEGTGGSFTISLNPPSAETITLNYTFQDGTATNPDDYTPDGGQSSGQTTFSPGATTQTLAFSTSDNAVADGQRQFTLALSLQSGTAILANGIGTATITDNDSAGVIITPASGLLTREDGLAVTVSVQLTSQPGSVVVIDWQSLHPSEAMVSPAQLTFSEQDWQATQTVTITGVDDPHVDGDQSFTIVPTISNQTTDPAYVGLSLPQINGINQDDDQAGLSVTPGQSRVAEDNPGQHHITVSLSPAPQPGEVVTASLVYDTSQLSLAIDSVQFDTTHHMPVTIAVEAVDDGVAEPVTTYTINVQTTSSTGSPLGGLSATVQVTVFDQADQIIEHVPNLGLIQVDITQNQPLYEAPGGGVIRNADASEMRIPVDSDGNGYDTFVVTAIRTHEGRRWLGLWMGSARWAWLPYDDNPYGFTVLTPIDWSHTGVWSP